MVRLATALLRPQQPHRDAAAVLGPITAAGEADDGGDSGLNAVPDERGRILRGAGCRRRGAGFRGCGVALVLILRLVSCKQYY